GINPFHLLTATTRNNNMLPFRRLNCILLPNSLHAFIKLFTEFHCATAVVVLNQAIPNHEHKKGMGMVIRKL
ncbi:hypothetical protein P3435_24140, partial [Vibrio parahaemolyticus]|nr:hypothetical protein [Vibrio parahaemolyticus]